MQHHPPSQKQLRRSWNRQLAHVLLGIVAFVIFGTTVEAEFGVSWETTYRIGCAIICLALIVKFAVDEPEAEWPRISLWVASILNIGLFFTPLFDRPASRGEIMLFALPDAIIVLGVMLATSRRESMRERAMKQQMILGLVVAVVFCTVIFAFALMEPPVR